jgi:hypothetical protein
LCLYQAWKRGKTFSIEAIEDIFLWLYQWNRARIMLGETGETREKFENHGLSPTARDFQTFLVFLPTSRMLYFTGKVIEIYLLLLLWYSKRQFRSK